MPRVGFEPTVPVFEREKTVHALERAATINSLLGILVVQIPKIIYSSGLIMQEVME
jgi:hypothetical protein